jgi:purine-binding chemotaxis protein CheW
MSTDNTGTVTQYLTFTLGEEVYAIEISQVREVLEFTTVTKVPRTPDFMRGVVNLRGSVVPVVDLRMKFGLSRTEKTVNTCNIIVEVVLENEMVVIGVLADSVQEVFEFEADQIEPPPRIGTKLDTDFIKGIGKRDKHFIIILDIDRILTHGELSIVQQSSLVSSQDEVGTGTPEENAPQEDGTGEV